MTSGDASSSAHARSRWACASSSYLKPSWYLSWPVSSGSKSKLTPPVSMPSMPHTSCISIVSSVDADMKALYELISRWIGWLGSSSCSALVSGPSLEASPMQTIPKTKKAPMHASRPGRGLMIAYGKTSSKTFVSTPFLTSPAPPRAAICVVVSPRSPVRQQPQRRSQHVW